MLVEADDSWVPLGVARYIAGTRHLQVVPRKRFEDRPELAKYMEEVAILSLSDDPDLASIVREWQLDPTLEHGTFVEAKLANLYPKWRRSRATSKSFAPLLKGIEMKNQDIRTIDCSDEKVILVRGVEAKDVRSNPTASHLRAEFVLPGALADGEELHIFTTRDEIDLTNVTKLIRELGFDVSEAVVAKRI